jgi:valyl-tRNA synthetase
MYYLKYKFEDSDEYLEIATTRLETLASDTAVVVHPEDQRYIHLLGKKVITPLRKEAVPIIADEYIDIAFGTGIMKCSAHGNGDFEILMKNGLEVRESINPDGTLNANALEFEGLDRQTGRLKIAEKLLAEGLITRVEDHSHEVGHSERTDAVVEIMVMPQWFVKMEPLATQVLEWQKDESKKVEFVPERFESILTNWMDSIQDWCISRQIWWGHRIPAWYKGDEVIVSETCPGVGYVQDEDVLDTWFSSALWPFSTLGWPEKTDDLKRFFPTDVLVTGYDIIFFWVSRMIFQSLEFMKEKPFKQVLLHGLIRDEQGRKMSKSLGNGVDPMDVIDRYGADALRFFLTTNSAPGLDLRYSTEKMDASWNFINKLWNASRFVLMNIDETFISQDLVPSNLSDIDLWITERFDEMLVKVTQAMEKYEFSLAGSFLYDFVWNDYCSWYIELSKVNLNSDDPKLKSNTQQTLISVLRNILKVLHPSLPFVTEKIYENFEEGALCIASWPLVYDFKQVSAKQNIDELIALISDLRSLKTEFNLKPSTELSIVLEDSNFGYAIHLEKLIKSYVVEHLEGDTMIRPYAGGSYRVERSKLIDVAAEKDRLSKELIRLEAEMKRSSSMLSNERFMSSAPQAKVEEEKQKYEEYKRQYDLVKDAYEKIGNQG